MEREIISHSPHAASEGRERRVDLDWVRIAAFGLLIFYHVGMLYVSWGFHIKSAHRITALEPLMLILNPWRLALLFLVSGAATRFMLRKYAVGPLIRSRSSRLLIPLIFGMLVIVPPQAYDQIVESSRLSRRIPRFLRPALFRVRCAVLPARPLHSAADLEPSVVRGLSLDLHDGAWRRSGCRSRTCRLDRAQARSRAVGRAAPGRAVGRVSDLSLDLAAELSFDTCAVRRLVQPLGLRNGLPARLSARPRRRLLGRGRASALGGAVISGGVLPVSSRVALDPRHRDAAIAAAEALWRDRLWLLSMALHCRRARLRAALAHGRFSRATISDRCDLSLLYRASDRDHHDRARTARPRSASLAGSRHCDLGHVCRVRADL